MNAVLGYVDQNRIRLNLEQFQIPRRLSCAIITPRFRASRHVVFLMMPQGNPTPVLVAKVARLADEKTGVAREAENLVRLASKNAAPNGTVPKLITVDDVGGHPLLLETALAGKGLDPATMRGNFRENVQDVVEWLSDFHQSTIERPAQGDEWFTTLVEQPLADLSARLPHSDDEHRLLEQTRALVDPLRDLSIPLVFEHGDFADPNLLRMPDGKIGVLDWELARPRGLPMCDLFFFLTYAAFALRKVGSSARRDKAFLEAFFGDNAWSSAYVRAYARRLELPSEAMRPLFLLCWVQQVAGFAQRLGGADQNRATAQTAKWIRENRYYALWKLAVEHIEGFCR